MVRRLVTLDAAGLEVLDRAECRRLLDAGGVGRVALPGDPPVLRPVNFVLDADRIVIRTGPGSLWRAASQGTSATFEVDGIRNVDHGGWSVVVSGRLAVVEPDEHVCRLPLRAWAPRTRDRFVTVAIDALSGRRLTGRP